MSIQIKQGQKRNYIKIYQIFWRELHIENNITDALSVKSICDLRIDFSYTKAQKTKHIMGWSSKYAKKDKMSGRQRGRRRKQHLLHDFVCQGCECASARNSLMKVSAHVQLFSWSTSMMDTLLCSPDQGLRAQVPGVLPVAAFSCHPCLEIASAEDSLFIQGCVPFMGQPNPMTGACRV